MNNLSVEEESKIVSVFHTTEQYIHNYVHKLIWDTIYTYLNVPYALSVHRCLISITPILNNLIYWSINMIRVV
mgnify:CR=1 FL=1